MVGLICFGLLLSSFGLLWYWRSQSGFSSHPTFGTFLLGWTPPADQAYADQWFTLELDTSRNRALLDYSISFNKPGVYILQVLFPFTVESLTVNRFPPGQGSWSFLDAYPYGSIVRLTYKSDLPESESYTWLDFSILLNLNQTIVQANHGTYTMLLPANRPVPMPISYMMDSLQPYVGVVSGAGARHNIYRIFLPSDAIVVQTLPQNPSLGIASDNSVFLRWDLGGSLPALAITYSMPRELADYSDLSFKSGLAIGIGIPTSISGLIEFYELDNKDKAGFGTKRSSRARE